MNGRAGATKPIISMVGQACINGRAGATKPTKKTIKRMILYSLIKNSVFSFIDSTFLVAPIPSILTVCILYRINQLIDTTYIHSCYSFIWHVNKHK